MNFIEPPSTRVSGTGPDAGDIDSLLRRYFRSAMPKPWPTVAQPALPIRSPRRFGVVWRSRLTLAASVACLLIGSVWFANRAPEKASQSSGWQEGRNRKELRQSPQSNPFVLPSTPKHRGAH
jgi:hypothetical protein